MAEHDRLRQILDTVMRVVDGDGWAQPGPQLDLLRRLLRDFQEFETRTHRPKGVVLLASVRGRSVAADQLLDVLEQESRQAEQLLGRALDLLEAIAQGGPALADEAASLLREHRDLVLRQLDQEDTDLRSYTAQLLTPQEWSAVASSMSKIRTESARSRARR